MIELNKLPKITRRPKKRLGQGHGSGKGKSAGRGTKGQKAKEKMKVAFSAVGSSLIRRLPLRRGKYRNKPTAKKPIAVNIKYLNILPPNSNVDIEILAKYKIIDKNEAQICGVKILGDGILNNSLSVNLPCSKSAAKKIIAAGGKVENKSRTLEKVRDKS